MSLFYGISVQPASFMGDGGQVIVDYNHRKELRYWGGHEQGWVDSLFAAKRWYTPKPGETPYAENNAYSLWMQYKIGPYRVATTHGLTLHPCGIAFHNLYLKSLHRPEPDFFSTDCSPPLITEWTSSIYDAMKISGIGELRRIFFTIVQEYAP